MTIISSEMKEQSIQKIMKQSLNYEKLKKFEEKIKENGGNNYGYK